MNFTLTDIDHVHVYVKDKQRAENWYADVMKLHFATHTISFRETDHDLAYSLYFSDPDGNTFEITAYTI